MKLITVAGPPSCGKTSVIIKTLHFLRETGLKVGAVKMDCLSSQDGDLYRQAGLPHLVGLSANLCPDHFFITNIEDCWRWGESQGLDLLVTESAGLCNRCAPHVRGHWAVCVLDNLAGIDTPRKIGPMLKTADQILITKGDIVSQAEREVFAFRVRQANPQAVIRFANGMNGQGLAEVARLWADREAGPALEGNRLRFPVPAAVCSYCLGETKIGGDFQKGVIRRMPGVPS